MLSVTEGVPLDQTPPNLTDLAGQSQILNI